MDISQTIHLLGDLLGEIISDLESPALFETEERIRALAKSRRSGGTHAAAGLAEEIARLSPDHARAVASSFALYFDLVNLAEENQRVDELRQRETSLSGQKPLPESIREAVGMFKAQGVSREEMALLLSQLSIELVLTAHPTEAKRRTLLSKLQRIAELLRQIDQNGLLPRELDTLRGAIRAEIMAIWLTDRARTAKLEATDEVRTGLYHVDEFFWELLPRIYTDLDAALREHYPGLSAPPNWLRLGSWIGGDRDGNPNVTAAVTAETLRLHRGLAVEKHRAALQEAGRSLSLSSRRVPPPAPLTAWIESRRPLPAHAAFLEKRYAAEPYRLAISLLADDLAQASKDDMTARLLSREPHSARIQVSDLSEPLDIIARAIPPALAEGSLRHVRRQVDIFGLWAARLDIREESGRLNAALGELLRALGEATNFEALPPPARTGLLTHLLAQPTPQLAQNPGVTRQTAETLALFQLIARVRDIYGPDLLGPFIISMTHSPADVLTVLLLARWTGCDAGLEITPLFETIDDLRGAPGMLSDLFGLPAYRQHLETCAARQVVMIGYSDSNKDGGYLSANWNLYEAQENIARACREHAVKLTFFHGRGGTVARGGGPANRAIRAQPPGTVAGRFRLTEQGETITARYANPALGYHHIQQLASAVLLASNPRKADALPEAWRGVIAEISEAARRTYRGLVYETPGFLGYWQAATPLDELTRLQLGSRPAARQPGQAAVTKIRAIPWVFSWMQSRFNLPGWYGLGSGLTDSEDPGLLREMYAGWPFFTSLLDNAEMSLLKADMQIAALYAALAGSLPQSASIFATILAEYERTRDVVLAITGHANLMDGEPTTQRSIHLRNAYIDPLNFIQVEMLRRLRALPDPESSEAADLREVVIVTINGIAAGLRNTG